MQKKRKKKLYRNTLKTFKLQTNYRNKIQEHMMCIKIPKSNYNKKKKKHYPNTNVNIWS